VILPPTSPKDPRESLIIALDVPSARSAMDLVDRLEGQCQWFKVGLQLYLSEGISVVTSLRNQGFNVFLDLKLHDIPNTVGQTIKTLAKTGASLLTIHASGGSAMLQAAAEAADSVKGSPRLLAVTVLTSMGIKDLAQIGVAAPPDAQVLNLARLAIASGITGLVCSPREVTLLRTELGESPLLVVPGIRPSGAAANDQTRTATPAEALWAGASMLVIGRPITQAEDPAAAFAAIVSDLAAC